jgi:exonuclease SbcD
MKILFSADWHLGYVLGGANPQQRLPDQSRQLAKIAAYVDEHDVDVLAIAGDIFDESSLEGGRTRRMVQAFVRPFRDALDRGLQIVGVAGNHDRDWFFDTANTWLAAAAPTGADRIVLRTRPELLTVEARAERVNFALLPFPNAARYDLKSDDVGGVGQRNELMAKLFIAEMKKLRKKSAEQKLPTVLLAHVTVAGSTVKAHRISARDDVVIPRGEFPDFELTVIGHIHQPEQLGADPFYYVGGLDRMDVSERDYPSRALLADVGPAGLREVSSLPLDPTPFARVLARDEDELAAAADAIERKEDTLVKVVLSVPPGTYLPPLLGRARELFPRLYGNVECEWSELEEVETPIEGLNPVDVDETVRRYLEEQQMPSEEREALLTMVHELRQKIAAEVEA